MHLLIASVAILALAVAPAMASPWVNVDGDLSDWGLNPGAEGWTAGSAQMGSAILAQYVRDDLTHAQGSSGGEWYDIEALYCTIELDQAGDQWLSWALVTSYAGRDTYQSAADLRNAGATTGGSKTGDVYPYRRHPVLAIDVNGGTTWQYGVIMAPNHDFTWSGTSLNWNTSRPLLDTDRTGSWDDSWYADRPAGAGQNNPVASIGGADNPELWAVSAWRDAHPDEFDGTPFNHQNVDAHPVDFDVRSTAPNTDITMASDVYAGFLYLEDEYGQQTVAHPAVSGPGQVNADTWQQRDNWVWEGYVQIPTTAQDATYGIDLWTNPYLENIHYHYAEWCGNNDSQADSIGYKAPPPTPELGTWALLLATGALGGWVRRRRTD
jgi:hypothetical protein